VSGNGENRDRISARIPDAQCDEGAPMNDREDRKKLTGLNEQFIGAFRQGSWELLEPILSPSFSYLDGATGEVWSHERYVENLRSHQPRRWPSTSW
jgi:hypothetical protein